MALRTTDCGLFGDLLAVDQASFSPCLPPPHTSSPASPEALLPVPPVPCNPLLARLLSMSAYTASPEALPPAPPVLYNPLSGGTCSRALLTTKVFYLRAKLDVIFETSSGRQFTLEVWYFAIVLEMKENIQKYQGIPVSKHTLVFNGQVMVDDRDTQYYGVLQGSHIRLNMEDESGKPQEPIEVQILINLPTSSKLPTLKRHFHLEMSMVDIVAHLKEKTHEAEGISVKSLALIFGSTELQDHRSLAEYEVPNGSEVNVVIKPSPPASASSCLKKLRVMVLTQCDTKKIPIEVNVSDNVCELRKEFYWLHNHPHFHLPIDSYFFIYKQNVMDEDRTFHWHGVQQGDTIEMFNGCVTSGES